MLHSLKQAKNIASCWSTSKSTEKEGGEKKKVSFQQEMKVKSTEINSSTFEMVKNKHIVIDVQRDRVNR